MSRFDQHPPPWKPFLNKPIKHDNPVSTITNGISRISQIGGMRMVVGGGGGQDKSTKGGGANLLFGPVSQFPPPSKKQTQKQRENEKVGKRMEGAPGMCNPKSANENCMLF